MGAVRELAREAFRNEDRGVDWRSGVAGALTVAGPLWLGIALDEPITGLIAAVGGLNTALAVPRAALGPRMWWGSLAALGGTAAVALGAIGGRHLWSLLALTTLWVGAWAFWRAAGRAGALAGFLTSAALVILGGLVNEGVSVDWEAAWYAVGALWSLALMIPARRGPDARREPIGLVAREAVRALANGVAHDHALAGHATRLALTVAASTLLAHVIGLAHGYWVPLSTLAILQPGEHATRVRSLQRAAGTLAGATIIAGITLVTDDRWIYVAGAVVSAFALYALSHRSYFWLVILLTPTVLFMLSAAHFEGGELALDRIADSVLGIFIGLAVGEVVWPLWPHHPPPDR